MYNLNFVFVKKFNSLDSEKEKLLEEIKNYLHILNIDEIKIFKRYLTNNTPLDIIENSLYKIFGEVNQDTVYLNEIPFDISSNYFGVEYLPGQYDQRADSTSQALQILSNYNNYNIICSTFYVIEGSITKTETEKIKDYIINPIDSKEAFLDLNYYNIEKIKHKKEIEIIDNFINMNKNELINFHKNNSLAMNIEDLEYCQSYFLKEEKRNPTYTEIKVLDTYWSDHCRHTTFLTNIESIEFEDNFLLEISKKTYEKYIEIRKIVYENKKKKNITLMDLATIMGKYLLKNGLLDNLDISDEINACSIKIKANINDSLEDWIIMFKNETHNHPTEIEPFGGASTCLGGAIRDPLSGRTYVYQSMRVTGSADPTSPLEKTIKGKLPQKIITTKAALGYSSYGNQIGVCTGLVDELYNSGYLAKRMEVGAVVGAAPAVNIIRKKPKKDDLVILVGGKTGRDGCGGATGSSKKHDENSVEQLGSEVQKGNPIEERKIQRFFRNKDVANLIIKCNDFGAGGASVAIGELTDGIDIYLDKIHKKYDGLDGTELAISESQERMAVVVEPKNINKFIKLALEENLEASIVAKVTDSNRLKMFWNNKTIVDIDRDFLNSAGVKQNQKVLITKPLINNYFQNKIKNNCLYSSLKEKLSDLNICNKKELIEMFDNSIGSSNVLSSFGGKYQLTPIHTMVSKLPVIEGDTTTCTAMTFGFNPDLFLWSTFHGAYFAVLESISKLISSGVNLKDIRLSFQEYFERLEKIPHKWGNPFNALLGALKTQNDFNLAAIGGKDSMSGSYKDELHVPPTLISFALAPIDVEKVISPEIKSIETNIVLVYSNFDKNFIPSNTELINIYNNINKLNKLKRIKSAYPILKGGLIVSLLKMCFGNKIGVGLSSNLSIDELFFEYYGGILLEIDKDINLSEYFDEKNYIIVGRTLSDPIIKYNTELIKINDLIEIWSKPLKSIFKNNNTDIKENIISKYYENKNFYYSKNKKASPKVFVPIFPGTNCEYDTQKAFYQEGAFVKTKLFKNIKPEFIKESINEFVNTIKESQIIAFPGGFSAGDEPDGSAKFISVIFNNEKIKNSIHDFLYNNDGLILGICNGFQALIKLGLLPYGKIENISKNHPTLTHNKVGKHVAKIVHTKIISNLSPWLYGVKPGDVHSIPVSHGEGRFICDEDIYLNLLDKGQIATQYIDLKEKPTYEYDFNPNGSYMAVEGITSKDGRIFGKMAHSERIGNHIFKNIPGNKNQKIFKSGVDYFRL